ncbi:hypothetical protein OROGR_033557 [Orobanche gracilis]
MPIGIPKVPFSIPGDNERGWDLISHELFRRRIFFLFGEMNEESVNNVIGGIIYFNNENPNRDQLVFINSRGGKLAWTSSLSGYTRVGGAYHYHRPGNSRWNGMFGPGCRKHTYSTPKPFGKNA